MDQIKICNWILTRRCNLKCSYCAIVRDYIGKPEEYPPMKHYKQNEMTTGKILLMLDTLTQHNPDMFHIFYGGEPLLRDDLPVIINYCNSNNIHYTIITNNTEEIQPRIEKLFDRTDGNIKGLTSSVDPVLFDSESKEDRVRKSISGLKNLLKYRGRINDLVAEITVMRENLPYLYELVKTLTKEEINSDITFIDIAKNPYYDFSNITDEKFLVTKEEFNHIYQRMMLDSSLNIHMKEKLLPMIYEILPSELDCGLESDVHNIAIDADGSIRLCLRIRGKRVPQNVGFTNLLTPDLKTASPFAKINFKRDKEEFCAGCNHTCYLMSKIEDSVDDLVHTEIRGGK